MFCSRMAIKQTLLWLNLLKKTSQNFPWHTNATAGLCLFSGATTASCSKVQKNNIWRRRSDCRPLLFNLINTDEWYSIWYSTNIVWAIVSPQLCQLDTAVLSCGSCTLDRLPNMKSIMNSDSKTTTVRSAMSCEKQMSSCKTCER